MQGKLDIYEKRYDVSGVTRGIELNFMGKILHTIWNYGHKFALKMSELVFIEHALQSEPYFIIYISQNKAKDACAANTYSHSNFAHSSIFYRAEQHEKEVQTLKTQIKSHKRRLKVMSHI